MTETTPAPNVVFVLTDDQGPWAAGCCGNDEIRTPNIDRLAAHGLRFPDFFCTSPVCSPARASLMTGRIPSAHGVHDWIRGGNMPPDAARYLAGLTCYTDVLAANGYTCGLSGKWHLGDSMTPQHGFTHWFALPKGGSRYNDAEMIRDGRVEVQPGYLTDVITDDAIGFINANRARPFYLSVNYTAPHTPFEGHPRDIVNSYDDCPFKTCPQEAAHPWIRPHERFHLGNRESLKGYFAAVTALDMGVGRIMDRLEELGLRERTLFIFSSDNGYSCGHHGFWHKGNGTFPLNMYENSVKVPFVISHPGSIPEGKEPDAMVSQYDFMPTLLDYLGLSCPDDALLPGRSHADVWRGESTEGRENIVVYDEYGPVRMIRTREWKYVHRYPCGPHELYDLAHDPGERRNLAEEKSRQPLMAELGERMAGWFSRYTVPLRDGSRAQVWGEGQMQPVTGRGYPETAFHACKDGWTLRVQWEPTTTA